MTPVAWRITKTKYVNDAFSGEGALTSAGRWNSKGVRMVYASAHSSLAVLEMLAHLEPIHPLPDYSLISVEIDDRLIDYLQDGSLPIDWRAMPSPASTRRIGDKWVKANRSLALSVPSVILPQERNILISPDHPDFNGITIGKPLPFELDPRLVSK